jgi:hypothetical protein
MPWRRDTNIITLNEQISDETQGKVVEISIRIRYSPLTADIPLIPIDKSQQIDLILSTCHKYCIDQIPSSQLIIATPRPLASQGQLFEWEIRYV